MTAPSTASTTSPAAASPSVHDKILIVDFGSQVTQLIARRVREMGVYSEIVPFQNAEKAFLAMKPKGVILSGSPASVLEDNAPTAPLSMLTAGQPVLGICYGEQVMAHLLGGKVEAGHHREFGRANIEVTAPCALFEGVWEVGGKYPVWMSHGDRVTEMPKGFRAVAKAPGSPISVIADDERKFYAMQFHPEVAHTPDGAKLIRNFVRNIAGCKGDWTMRAFREEAIEKIRAQVGKGRVICGLSGGVDSAVAAVLIHEAIGEQLTCVFVDHGLLRLAEAETVVDMFRNHYNIPLVHVDASKMFLGELAGVTDPEQKRKTIGRLFIDVFDAEAKKIGGADFLAQGTLYPDVIESVSFTGGPSVTIKSHHNVGGLAGAHEHEARRAVARIVQGRGEGARARAWIARRVRRPSSVSRSRSRHPHSRRHHAGEARHPAQGGCDLYRGNPPRRSLRHDLAGVCRAAAGQDRRRDGRRPHLRFTSWRCAR